MTRNAETTPVIVGVGEVADRPDDPRDAREPAALMAEALTRADADAGGEFLDRLDSLDIVNEVSWPYRDPVGVVCERLGVRPKRAVYGIVGGQTPIRYLHEALADDAHGVAIGPRH